MENKLAETNEINDNTESNVTPNAEKIETVSNAEENVNGTSSENHDVNKYPEQWAWAEKYNAMAELNSVKFVFDKTDYILSIAIAVVGILFSRFVVFTSFGLLTTIFFIALFTILLIYFKSKHKEITSFSKFVSAIGYIFSIVFFITDSRLIVGLDFIFEWIVFVYLAFSIGTDKKQIDSFLPMALLKSFFAIPFSNFGSQFSATSSGIKTSKKSSAIGSVIVGLLIGIPLFLFISNLLISADENMKNVIYRLYEIIDFDFSWIGYIIIAIPSSLYMYNTMYRNSFREGLDEFDEEECKRSLDESRKVNNIVYYTAVTPVIILYIVFFILQGSYFLSAFEHKLPLGFDTFSEYARKGFFELLVVAVINTFIMIVINITSKEKTKVLKIYNVIISFSTIILIITAISKMAMYIDGYGLTQDRVYSSWFMVLLALLFVIVIIKQFKENIKLSKCFTGVFLAMFALLCFSRPDAIIAKYNIEMYRANYLAEIDTFALSELSDDGKLIAVNEGVITAEKAKTCSETLQKESYIDILNLSSLILNGK